MKAFADIADYPEDDRITIIVKTVNDSGGIVGVALDDDEAKIVRYETKLRAAGVRVIARKPGLVANTILLQVGPKES